MIDVTFSPSGEGGTRLELAHRGWAAGAGARRAAYDRGWQALLHEDYAAYVADAAAKA